MRRKLKPPREVLIPWRQFFCQGHRSGRFFSDEWILGFSGIVGLRDFQGFGSSVLKDLGSSVFQGFGCLVFQGFGCSVLKDFRILKVFRDVWIFVVFQGFGLFSFADTNM
jgi:hypothetical protein